jgi:hypothetical protein
MFKYSLTPTPFIPEPIAKIYRELNQKSVSHPVINRRFVAIEKWIEFAPEKLLPILFWHSI